MLNPKSLPPGGEQYETFKRRCLNGRKSGICYQYDYRHTDGELFSCVKRTLDECRAARDRWINSRAEAN